MYIPKFNQVSDRALLLEAMRRYSFAILMGNGAGAEPPTATHLPLVVKDEGPHGLLLGHFAKANPHWNSLAGRETLVVFPGPHSYVSPSWYVDPMSVPTWNYIAIHAYGPLELVDDEAQKATLLDELIQVHELPYLDRWRAMPAGYRRTMLSGIMGFRIPITHIEGKFKLSQNRPQEDQQAIHAAHEAGSDDERELAYWMERLAVPITT